jgi:hypothetical protein
LQKSPAETQRSQKKQNDGSQPAAQAMAMMSTAQEVFRTPFQLIDANKELAIISAD